MQAIIKTTTTKIAKDSIVIEMVANDKDFQTCEFDGDNLVLTLSEEKACELLDFLNNEIHKAVNK